MMEMILQDFCQAYGLQGIALRYFNPIGADPKMRTGSYMKHQAIYWGRCYQFMKAKRISSISREHNGILAMEREFGIISMSGIWH